MNFHRPVLLREVMDFLDPQAGENFIDCTLGGGGYTSSLLEKIFPQGKVLAIDLDPESIKRVAEKRNNEVQSERLILANDNFKNLKEIFNKKKKLISPVKGIIFDLGLSSLQLSEKERGFSFRGDNLDMRFNPEAFGIKAVEIINHYPREKLIQIFRDFGQERLAKPIAEKILNIRKKQKIATPSMLVEVVAEIYKKYYKTKTRRTPATRVFQALRIAVNDELENLKKALPQVLEILAPRGKLVVISYHSLEEKIVKDFFREESRDCLCPPQIPICLCGHKAKIKILTPKPIRPTPEETRINPRSRSAKLRAAQLIE